MLPLAILVSIVLGCLSIVSASFHWVRSQKFGIAGMVLSNVGVILVGMSVWASVEYGASGPGIKPSDSTAIQRMIEDGNANVIAENKRANEKLSEQLERFTQQIRADQDRVFTDIQSHVLAIRTALTQQAIVTQQPGTDVGTSSAALPKRRPAKPR